MEKLLPAGGIHAKGQKCEGWKSGNMQLKLLLQLHLRSTDAAELHLVSLATAAI